MRFVKSAKLAAVALAAASGAALASAPANAATTPLQSVKCDRSDPTQLQFEGFMTLWPRACFKGSGDLDVNITSSIFGRAGDHSGYVIYEDGTKVNFTKGPLAFGLPKTVVHIHTD
ncbi:hypothetical protein [Streptomyces syringium]|uniref:hypothetical protein n=1 Tax=Streptomyces syringium TaxID=76729 RepID=UPI0034055E38